MNSLGLPEKGIILLLAVSALVAMTTQTPLLQDLSLGTDSRIFPDTLNEERSGFDLPRGISSMRIEREVRYGCIRFLTHSGQSMEPVCNRHLLCMDNSATGTNSSSFEVFKLPKPNTFYVETGSQCNSACCDWRGMSFTGEGKRLDDGVLQRLSLRLGVLGIVALTVGSLCFVWAL